MFPDTVFVSWSLRAMTPISSDVNPRILELRDGAIGVFPVLKEGDDPLVRTLNVCRLYVSCQSCSFDFGRI
jgi:hypothetical protein